MDLLRGGVDLGRGKGRGRGGEKVGGVATPSVTEAVKNTRFAMAYVTVASHANVRHVTRSSSA